MFFFLTREHTECLLLTYCISVYVVAYLDIASNTSPLTHMRNVPLIFFIAESAAVEKLLSTLSMVHQSQTAEDKTTSLPVCKPYRAEYLIHPDWRSEQ